MKFLGVPITKEQAKNLSVLEEEKQTGELELIQSAKALKMRAKLCKLNLKKLKDVKSPIIAKDKKEDFFIIAKSKEDKFMVLFADKTQPEIKSKEELAEIWDGTAILITKKRYSGQRSCFQLQMVYSYDFEVQERIYSSIDCCFHDSDSGNPDSGYDAGCCG